MDIFKKASLHKIGPGGIKCPCCDGGYSNKRNRPLKLSKLRRTLLKRETKSEINQID